jgi:hypothetical protein
VLEPDGTLSVLRTGLTLRTPAELAHPEAVYRG